MRQPRGKLTQGRQPFRPPRLCLRLLQAAVGFGQCLRQFLIAFRLPLCLDHKPIHHRARQKKEKNANGKLRVALHRDFVFLKSLEEIRTVRRRSQRRPT